MGNFDVREHNMSYLGLNGEQYDEYDRLMGMKTSEWSSELVQHIRNQPGAFCGDALACAVADWVKSKVS